jgi:hypothetical protein
MYQPECPLMRQLHAEDGEGERKDAQPKEYEVAPVRQWASGYQVHFATSASRVWETPALTGDCCCYFMLVLTEKQIP